MSLPARRRRVLLGAAALLLVVAGGVGSRSALAQSGPSEHGTGGGSGARAESVGPAAAPSVRDTVLSAGRRAIAEVGAGGQDRSRSLADTTGVLHEALAAGSGTPPAATVTDAAVTALDPTAGTAKLIATVRLGAGGEQRLDASMVLAGGSWKLAALAAVPVGATAPAGAGPGSGVTAEVGAALTRILSYSPDTTAATAQAAEQVLAGTAASQYRQLLGGITAQVRQQGLSLSTRVVRIGVEQQTADRAQLLVFLDQTAQRTGRAATSVGAQLSVTAQLGDGRWRIVQLVSR